LGAGEAGGGENLDAQTPDFSKVHEVTAVALIVAVDLRDYSRRTIFVFGKDAVVPDDRWDATQWISLPALPKVKMQ
jgi:hypothetical protein